MRVAGWLVRGALPGVRRVHAHVAAHARAWEASNEAALQGGGPLWVVLGDSTAQGVGADAYDEGYVGQLLEQLNEAAAGSGRSEEAAGDQGQWRVLNFSRSGAKVADVLGTQLPRLESLAVAPDLVTCAIGANDLVRRTPARQVADGLRSIIARLPEGAVIATIPQGLDRDRTAWLNELIRAEAAGRGLRVADVWVETAPPWRGKLAPDGFHPGPLGYADWARAFAKVVLPPAPS